MYFYQSNAVIGQSGNGRNGKAQGNVEYMLFFLAISIIVIAATVITVHIIK